MLHQEGHVFAEEGERRIRDDDVGVLEERDAFGGAEVAVALKPSEDVLLVANEPFDVRKVDAPVAVLVRHLGDDDLVGNLRDALRGGFIETALPRRFFGRAASPRPPSPNRSSCVYTTGLVA